VGQPRLGKAEWRPWIPAGRVCISIGSCLMLWNSLTFIPVGGSTPCLHFTTASLPTLHQIVVLPPAIHKHMPYFWQMVTNFTYRSTRGDSRRYLLCAGTLASRRPIRVLRSHTLRSFFAPRAGVRYDGLYKVSGWRITQDPKTKAIH
jgi:hypothetical protein